MAKNKLPSMLDNFSEWYLEVITRADLAEHAAIKGCMIIKPYGYAIWELIRDDLDKRFKAVGVKNACFPLFIPQSFLAREEDHLEGFSPEIAVVTYAGGSELTEPLVVRPTSETIIHDSMKRWIHSHRDLPMLLNQWCNVVRWEKHPRLFLRTSEFQWQEGHTAHATADGARADVAKMIQVYHDFSADILAIPTIIGRKSEKEKFAGAVESYSIEGLMPDGKALQMGTAHYLGENFSKMADVSFLDSDGVQKYVHMTSWGASTRLIGALIMAHGDDKGLVLPPRVAPTQVVIVPIGEAAEYAESIKSDLMVCGIRVEIDDREGVRPGSKFYDSEIRGIPLRFEVGEREITTSEVTYAVRHNATKGTLDRTRVVEFTLSLLKTIQRDMLQKATSKRNEHIVEANSKGDFIDLISEQAGFVRAHWCNETECELSIKEATRANTRNFPSNDQVLSADEPCVWCGKPSKVIAYFSKAY
jgi:prolyl-tRNA synthetase